MYIANINIIVAATTTGVIGKDNDIPWHLPEDLKRFKQITSGYPVIMGRKCWESIPEKYRPLPNRTNVVITRNEDYVAEGAEVRTNLLAAVEEFSTGPEHIFIIGGSQIYKEMFPYANILHLTKVHDDNIEGDVHLEGFNPIFWNLEAISDTRYHNGLGYNFEMYTRDNKQDLPSKQKREIKVTFNEDGSIVWNDTEHGIWKGHEDDLDKMENIFISNLKCHSLNIINQSHKDNVYHRTNNK